MVTSGPKTFCFAAISMATLFGLASPSVAQTMTSKEKAMLMLQRITSTKYPGDSALVGQIEARIQAGDLVGAARLATNEDGFYNLTIRDFATKMSVREESTQAPLSDFVAAFIGVTRDETDARDLLSGNFYYAGDPAVVSGSVRMNMVNDILKSNNHYDDLSTRNLRASLKRFDGQMAVDTNNAAVPLPDAAGVLSSRGWIGAHAIAGTNRRPVEYTLREFLCIPMTDAADATGPDDIVGRDVDRYPGGSNLKFQTSCKSCHTIMDDLRPAFGRFDFDGFVRNSAVLPNTGAGNTVNSDANGIIRKYNQNGTVFPGGYVTTNTNWNNNANFGANAEYFGWRGTLGGSGLKQYGVMIGNAKAFSKCMVKRAFRTVCKRETQPSDASLIDAEAASFELNGYKLRGLFERVAASRQCLGQ